MNEAINRPARGRALWRPGCWIPGCVAAVLFMWAGWWLSGAVAAAREAARQTACKGRLAQLHLAMINYHEEFGVFPPAYIADANGKPMHSWRVLIQRYLEPDFSRQYRFHEPWNSSYNLALARRTPCDFFRCPSNPRERNSDCTDYVVVVGPGTAFPDTGVTSLADMQDGTGNTILIAEIANSDIFWTEPRDLDAREISFLVNDSERPSISSPHPAGPAVVFADKIRAYRLLPSLRPATLRALTTIAGGERVTRESLERGAGTERFGLGD